MIDQRVLTPRRTAQPRHKAAPRLGVPAAVPRNVRPWPERSGTRVRAGAGAIASGLATASIAVLVTMTIAAGGHIVAGPRPAAPAASMSRPSAEMVPVGVPRLARPVRAVARPKRTPTRSAPAPAAGSAVSQPESPAPGPSSWTPSSGISYWQQMAERAGAPTWAVNMFSQGRHHRPGE